MKITILTIGDELLKGVTVNANASWLGQKFLKAGYPLTEIITVGDDIKSIMENLKYLWRRSDLILTTGGLGPTNDDVTIRALADFFNERLIFHQPTYEKLKTRLETKSIEITEEHKRQCLVPESVEVINNKSGTAPLLHFNKNCVDLYALPGVPFEMQRLVETEILPRVTRGQGSSIATRLVRTAGVAESSLFKDLRDIISPLPDGTVAFLPHIYGVDIRFLFDTSQFTELDIDRILSGIRTKLQEVIYTDSEESLSAVVGQKLSERGFTLSTAESCTGGLLADEVTNTPGSSDYYIEGFITYSNQAKIKRLGITERIISIYGAVSEEVAAAMAKGAQDITGTDIALSTTGIAGPGGGTREKPVGLVYIGFAAKNDVKVWRFQLGSDRQLNKKRTVYTALNMLRLNL